MQSIKEEFEKALNIEVLQPKIDNIGISHASFSEVALWAAWWTINYLIDRGFVNDADIQSLELLAKELEGTP